MKNNREPNYPLAAGLLLLSVTNIARHTLASFPDLLAIALMVAAIALEAWGVVKMRRAPGFENTALRKWKKAHLPWLFKQEAGK